MATLVSDPRENLFVGELIPVAGEETAEDRASRREVIQRRQRYDRHWTMLWVSIAILVFAVLLRTDSDGRVAPAWFPGLPLPELCGSRAWFGIECPGCGLTRSFIALAHGDITESLRYHRVGWVLAVAVLLQIPYRIFALRELRSGLVERNWPKWCGWGIILLLIGNWLGKSTELF